MPGHGSRWLVGQESDEADVGHAGCLDELLNHRFHGDVADEEGIYLSSDGAERGIDGSESALRIEVEERRNVDTAPGLTTDLGSAVLYELDSSPQPFGRWYEAIFMGPSTGYLLPYPDSAARKFRLGMNRLECTCLSCWCRVCPAVRGRWPLSRSRHIAP